MLLDAEKVFRLKPKHSLGNTWGICNYISEHLLFHTLVGNDRHAVNDWLFDRFPDYDSVYKFTHGRTQVHAWAIQAEGHNYERSDWCLAELLKLPLLIKE